MALKTLSITVDTGDAGRVDFVVRRLSESSRSQVRGMVDHGCVYINGVPCETVSASVAAGDVVSIRYDPTQRYREKKKNWLDPTFRISFEDEHLIVVDKSAGSLTVPTDHNENNTLVDRVSRYLGHSGRNRQAWVVHRLDRGASGLLVFGKYKTSADRLIQQFKQRKPRRVYTAIVAGSLPHDAGTYDWHLATAKNLDRFVARPSRSTESAVTHYRVLGRLRDTTHVEVTLETGRRNQIRVHFAQAGHPILGDRRYKANEALHRQWTHRRLALHAGELGFAHPISHTAMTFESPLPPEFGKFLASNC